MRRRDFLTTMAAGSVVSALNLKNVEAIMTAEQTPPSRDLKTDADVFSQTELKPSGKYYEAEVPDTLDLAERARLAVRGLINFGDPERHYENYQMGYFNTQPAYMSHYGAVGAEWGGIAEGVLMCRHVSGSTENLPEQEKMFQGILQLINADGAFEVQTDNSWLAPIGRTSDTLTPKNTARMLMAFIAQNEVRPSARLTGVISRMADSICSAAKVNGEYANLPSAPPRYTGEILGPWHIIINHGHALRALSRTYALTGDKKYLEMCEKFKNVIMKPEYWAPEAEPKVITGGEHGQFDGHIHSVATAYMGLLWYASFTNDAHLKEFVRDGYEFIRNFGISRMGLFGEQCVTADMAWLAIKLSDLGVGDYWEDADQYIRNQLTEAQVTDGALMHQINATMPKLVEMKSPKYAVRGYTTDRVLDRFVGAWRTDASNPAMTYPHNFSFVVCCTNNNSPVLHGAWEAITRYSDGTARVNLLLNRASPWLDMDSYLPYEGKVVIRNKMAKTMFVRIPRWVDQSKVTAEVNGKRTANGWVGRYLFLEGVRGGDKIQIDFPMVESKETYTLKWKPESHWLEVANPGYDWKPDNPPNRYTLHLKGNTVVDVSPRQELAVDKKDTEAQDVLNTVGKQQTSDSGSGLPLYARTYYQRDKAPMKQVTRYVSPLIIKW